MCVERRVLYQKIFTQRQPYIFITVNVIFAMRKLRYFIWDYNYYLEFSRLILG